MCALLSICSLHDLEGLPFDRAGTCYHDDGVEVTNDAAITKQRAHVCFLTLHGFSYFTEAFHFPSRRQSVGFTLVSSQKETQKAALADSLDLLNIRISFTLQLNHLLLPQTLATSPIPHLLLHRQTEPTRRILTIRFSEATRQKHNLP